MKHTSTRNRITTAFSFFSLILIFLISGQQAQAQDIQLQTQLTLKDITFGIRVEYTGYMASSLNIGPSLNMKAEGIPLGGVVRVRQSFFLPDFPLEIAAVGELEMFNSDGGFVCLPGIGGDLGLRFAFLKQDLLLTAGYRYGFTEFLESYQGDQISVERIERIYTMPIHIGLTWKF